MEKTKVTMINNKSSINQTRRSDLIPLVRNLDLNKTKLINMFNNYESIVEANKTLNMNMNRSTTCLIYQGY